MELKTELGVEIFINENGAITLRQHCELTYEDKYICISPNQFSKLAMWVEHHQLEIAEAWNDGIAQEDEDEIDS
jgi:hypothetical protein